MAPRVIYQATGWTVTQDPFDRRNPNLVRFHRSTGQRKLLDQIAEWTGAGWSSRRWMPKAPTVPAALLRHVEALMREVQP
jgi:hypothetical protein